MIALNVLVLNFSFSWIMLHDFSVLFMNIYIYIQKFHARYYSTNSRFFKTHIIKSIILRMYEQCFPNKDKGWISLKQQADRWPKINSTSDNSWFNLTLVFSKVADTSKAFGKAHASRRTITRE